LLLIELAKGEKLKTAKQGAKVITLIEGEQQSIC
jgi:hypothetical protein